jgi:hypothetical protein
MKAASTRASRRCGAWRCGSLSSFHKPRNLNMEDPDCPTRRLSPSIGRAFAVPEPTGASPLERREIQPHSGASASKRKRCVRVHEHTYQFKPRQSPHGVVSDSLAFCNQNNASALWRAPLRTYSRDRYPQPWPHIVRFPTPRNLTAARPRSAANRTRGPPKPIPSPIIA